MFHQVKIPETDVDFLRFLWWPGGDTTQALREFRMTVHLFGAVSSPSCANFALKQTAEDNEGKADSSALNTIRHNFYVDDCVKSVPDENQAISLVQNLKKICATGGFKLTKWTSNSRSVLASLPVEEKAKEVKNIDLEKDKLPVERALGMRWDVESDTFFFDITPKQQPVSRRGILSVLNSVYDPLGFFSLVMLTGKLIQQELCKINCGWDGEIPPALASKWSEWQKDLHGISDFRIERCYKPVDFDVTDTQLHHFCDASESGYGTVSYIRFTSESKPPHIMLVMGKARVAPLKVVTIPRMELTAAVLAARIDNMLRKELGLQISDSFFWTDSTSVLKYILSDTQRFKTFVANRVSLIRDLTQKSQWRHIKTDLNPADNASRGMRADAFLKERCRLNGPDFLDKCEADWPKLSTQPLVLSDSDSEVKKTVVAFATTIHEDPLTRFIESFSSWDKLIRSTAWLLKFKGTLRHLIQLKKACTSHSASVKSEYVKDKQLSDQQLSVQDFTEADAYVQPPGYSV